MIHQELFEVDGFTFNLRVYPTPKFLCEGINSVTPDNQHVLMLDYDCCDFAVVKRDLIYLNEVHDFAPFFIYRTDFESWHVRCPAKATYYELSKILPHLHCDPKAIDEFTGYKRKTTHRVSARGKKPKPTLQHVWVHGWYTNRELSMGHLLLFLEDSTESTRKTILQKRRYKKDNSAISDVEMVVYETARGSEVNDKVRK